VRKKEGSKAVLTAPLGLLSGVIRNLSHQTKAEEEEMPIQSHERNEALVMFPVAHRERFQFYAVQWFRLFI